MKRPQHLIIAFLASSALLWACNTDAQPFQPEDVVHTIDQHQLKYKHILAYVDMEMEGEDPALLQDQTHIQELTQECIEEFVDSPEELIMDLDQHYEAMKMGMGFTNQAAHSSQQLQANTQGANDQVQTATGGSQWKQLLSGSELYYTVTESHNGIFIQTTQYMHLCPNGTVHFYQNSGGGGGPITAPGQVEYTGAMNWDVTEQGGQTYFQFGMQGQKNATPLRTINQKIQIQGLGNFDINPGGAQCN